MLASQFVSPFLFSKAKKTPCGHGLILGRVRVRLVGRKERVSCRCRCSCWWLENALKCCVELDVGVRCLPVKRKRFVTRRSTKPTNLQIHQNN